MPLHIKDEAATEAVRRLAQARKITLTEAVREACAEALERDKNRVPACRPPRSAVRKTGRLAAHRP